MFDNILLVTDIDGTLLTDEKEILPEDFSAINAFRAQGGLVALATGRGVTLSRPIVRMLDLSIPAVIFNGAAVYDFKTEEFLWQSLLPQSAYDYAKMFKERFPSVAVEILVDVDVYVTSTNAREEEHIKYGGSEPLRDVPPPSEGWIKILLVDEQDTIDELIDYAGKLNMTDVHTVRSSPYYYEILPKGINKGGGLLKLIEIVGIKSRKIVAAGDFMNDIEMLECADLPVAVANAEDSVKAAAKYISKKDNNSGALADIIAYLRANPL